MHKINVSMYEAIASAPGITQVALLAPLLLDVVCVLAPLACPEALLEMLLEIALETSLETSLAEYVEETNPVVAAVVTIPENVSVVPSKTTAFPVKGALTMSPSTVAPAPAASSVVDPAAATISEDPRSRAVIV